MAVQIPAGEDRSGHPAMEHFCGQLEEVMAWFVTSQEEPGVMTCRGCRYSNVDGGLAHVPEVHPSWCPARPLLVEMFGG